MITASPSLQRYVERAGLPTRNSCDRFIAGVAAYLAVESWLDWFENTAGKTLPPRCEILDEAEIPNEAAVHAALFFAGGVVAKDPYYGGVRSLAVTLAGAFRRMWPDADRDEWINGTWAMELGWYLAAAADGSGAGWEDDDDHPPHDLQYPPIEPKSEDYFAMPDEVCSADARMKTKVILIGPGAAGKDYLAKGLVERGFVKAVSLTTRPPRTGEVDGVDYYFTTDQDFRQRINNDEFLEWYSFGADNWLYGTLRRQYDTSNLFIMSPPVLAQLPEEIREDAVIVFLNIPEDIRRARLEDRADADKVDRRLAADRHDFEGFDSFNLEVTDPEFDVDEVMAAIYARESD